MISALQNIFEKNQAWAASVKDNDPDFFSRLSEQQSPDYLWIGCADSRVPACKIMGLDPGEVFVHRNIANVVAQDDTNCLAVLQYAVEVLKVKHIIVCGHYGCGGIKAATEGPLEGPVESWLHHIREVLQHHTRELDDIDEEKKLNLLAEYNVIEQVDNVCNTDTVRSCWDNGMDVSVHGLVYYLKDGLLKHLTTKTA